VIGADNGEVPPRYGANIVMTIHNDSDTTTWTATPISVTGTWSEAVPFGSDDQSPSPDGHADCAPCGDNNGMGTWFTTTDSTSTTVLFNGVGASFALLPGETLTSDTVIDWVMQGTGFELQATSRTVTFDFVLTYLIDGESTPRTDDATFTLTIPGVV
jgi:hypothetical protein